MSGMPYFVMIAYEFIFLSFFKFRQYSFSGIASIAFVAHLMKKEQRCTHDVVRWIVPCVCSAYSRKRPSIWCGQVWSYSTANSSLNVQRLSTLTPAALSLAAAVTSHWCTIKGTLLLTFTAKFFMNLLYLRARFVRTFWHYGMRTKKIMARSAVTRKAHYLSAIYSHLVARNSAGISQRSLMLGLLLESTPQPFDEHTILCSSLTAATDKPKQAQSFLLLARCRSSKRSTKIYLTLHIKALETVRLKNTSFTHSRNSFYSCHNLKPC